MTDRIKGLTVILEKDVREDDLEVFIQAISLMKGVQQVIPREANHEDIIQEMRTKSDMKSKIYEFIKNL